MRKKILLSIIIIGVIGVLIGTGVFAYFSDTETSTGNTFTAGTLNLKVGSADPTTETITVSDTYGGDGGSYDWLLKNDGSIAGSLDVTFSSIVDAENGVNEPEEADPGEDGSVAVPGTNGELAEVLSVTIYIDENDDDAYVALDDTLNRLHTRVRGAGGGF
jgi:predicted ribosomally synthesized peptide with SipW-like signal peptide